jgi:hypothetical protein
VIDTSNEHSDPAGQCPYRPRKSGRLFGRGHLSQKLAVTLGDNGALVKVPGYRRLSELQENLPDGTLVGERRSHQ